MSEKEDKYLQLIDEMDDEGLDELIYRTYLRVFVENKDEANKDKRIPSIREVFLRADYDFDVNSYAMVYGIDKSRLTEENIMLLLQKRECIYRWGGFICCDSQLTMFDELVNPDDEYRTFDLLNAATP